MQRRALAYALTVLLLATATAGCFDSGGEAPDKVKAWRTERDDNAPFGRAPAEVALDGDRVVVRGSLGDVDRLEPTRIVPGAVFPDDQPLLYFDETTLADGRSGLVVVKGDTLPVESGALTDVPVGRIETTDRVRVHSPMDDTGVDDPGDVPSWEAANDSAFHAERWGPTPEDLRIGNASRAVLVSDGESQPLEPPIVVDGGRIYSDRSVKLDVPDVTVAADRFRVAGNVSGGHARIQDGPSATAPSVVTGSADTVVVTPGHVEAQGPTRITQIVDDGEPMLDAELELFVPQDQVQVTEGDQVHVTVWYRERSYVGDALIQGASVDGAPKNLTRVPAENPSFLEDLGPLGALVLAPAGPAFVLLFAFVSLFHDEPEPMPTWIDAGRVGWFEIVVDGDAVDPGTYDPRLTLSGNFPDASASLNIEVLPSADGG